MALSLVNTPHFEVRPRFSNIEGSGRRDFHSLNLKGNHVGFHGIQYKEFLPQSCIRFNQTKLKHASKLCKVAMASLEKTEGPSDSEVVVPPGSVSVVLLAGGVGKRMGANMPKQYLPLMDQPIALYSLFTFSKLAEVGEIVVVCDSSYQYLFKDAIPQLNVPLKFASPGKERQDSVFNGLQEINPASSLVAVHDSARPLVTSEDTKNVMRDALKHGAAVLGVQVKATIKEANSGMFVTKTLNRSLLWEMQTPQVIVPELLKKGFDFVKRECLEVTDDVSIVEHLGHPVCITPGSYTNLKVTTPDDLLVAERILSQDT